MWRRDDGTKPPAELVSFPGWPVYTDAKAWQRDFEEWQAARRRWAEAHGMSDDDLPAKIGDAPWDDSLI
ncbi:hypothetical protein [Mycobacterium marinum]|uniref:hypothetical protein n=1 Tax=Mycobacterium marinum TaxID=1781 RepID=UPI00356658CD